MTLCALSLDACIPFQLTVPILSGIQPVELCQLGVTLSLANSAILGPTISLSVVPLAIDTKMRQEGKKSLGMMVSLVKGKCNPETS